MNWAKKLQITGIPVSFFFFFEIFKWAYFTYKHFIMEYPAFRKFFKQTDSFISLEESMDLVSNRAKLEKYFIIKGIMINYYLGTLQISYWAPKVNNACQRHCVVKEILKYFLCLKFKKKTFCKNKVCYYSTFKLKRSFMMTTL